CHRLFVCGLNLGVQGGVSRADSDAHNRMRKLVDEDVLAKVTGTRTAEQSPFGACRRIAAETAGAAIPILLVRHAGDAAGLVVIGLLLRSQTRIVAPRTL